MTAHTVHTALSALPAASGPVEVTGGSALLVIAAFLLLAVASVLSVLVTYRLARGYVRTGTRPLLYLAIGIFLLTAAPTAIRLAFTNLATATAYRTLAASASELLGLLLILYTIHR
jgi:hypothetical protein